MNYLSNFPKIVSPRVELSMAREDYSISKSGSLSNENRSSQNRKHRQVLRKYIRTYIIPVMEEEKNGSESDLQKIESFKKRNPQ